MKKLLLLSLVTALLLTFSVAVSAAATPVEKPELSVLINGEYADFGEIVPINVDGYNLIPIRELAVALGIPTDNIKYDDATKAVTLVTADKKTTINVTVGSTEAKVNDKAETLSTAPVNYKDKVYLPVAVVAKALGNVVLWEEKAQTVIIRDEKELAAVKALLAANQDNKAQDRISATGVLTMNMDAMGQSITMKSDMDIKVDIAGKKAIVKQNSSFMGQDIISTTYMDGDAIYVDDGEQVMKMAFPFEDYITNLVPSFDSITESLNDTMAAALSLKQNDDGTVTISGPVFMGDLLSQMSDISIPGLGDFGDILSSVDFKAMYIEMNIDAKTNFPLTTKMTMVMSMNSDGMEADMDIDMDMKYDLKDKSKITIPADVIKKAVEIEMPTLEVVE